jgi:hypothetical protein
VSKEKTGNLLIKTSGNTNKILSKNEQTFNKLIKKIESLGKKLFSTEQLLNDKLSFYVKNIYPLDTNLANLKAEFIKLLHKYKLEKGSFSKSERAALKDLLIDEVNDYLNLKEGETDKEIEQIFKELHGISLKDAEKESFENAKNEFRNMFSENDFDFNFDDFKHDMSDDEMAKKMHEMKEKLGEQAQNFTKSKPKAKTQKQLEKEQKEKEIEEAKTKSISSIYKQLAKILHPDLERDETLRIEKEEYMKQLNVAYKKKDIHTLLKLELMWINKLENADNKLTDDKLKIYIEVIKEQARELEENEYRIIQHPRYESLHRLVYIPTQIKRLDLNSIKKSSEEKIEAIETNIKNIKSSKCISEIKKIINNNKNKEVDLFDFMSNFTF